MTTWLKALIATTCVVLLAAVGFWSWKLLGDEARDKVTAQEAANRLACDQLVRDLKSDARGHVLAEPLFCIEHGYLTTQHLHANGLGEVAAKVTEHLATYGPAGKR